jgi:proteasome assembly chaperone (PAC2) family protein
MPEKELTLLLQVAGGFMVVLGVLAGFIWSCLHYIGKHHINDNDSAHKVMNEMLKSIAEEVDSIKIELTVLRTQRDAIMCEKMKQHIQQ